MSQVCFLATRSGSSPLRGLVSPVSDIVCWILLSFSLLFYYPAGAQNRAEAGRWHGQDRWSGRPSLINVRIDPTAVSPVTLRTAIMG